MRGKAQITGEIPEGGELRTLGDVSSDIAYGYTASARSAPVGPKFLRITDIQNGFVNWQSVPHCEISEGNQKKYRLEKGDICIARTGASTGTNYTVKENVEAVFASYLIRYKINKAVADPFYVGLLLKSPKWRDHVSSIIGGSAQPGANAKQFARFEFPLPPLEEQRAIAKILGDLDDKIELNHRMNKTLEAIAQAIFRRWFVDFEFPNEHGQHYKSSGGKMIDSELGEIPEGWEVKPLDQIADFLNGLALQKYPPTGVDYLPVIKIRELRQGISESSDKASSEIAEEYIVNDGDMLFSWSGSLDICLWTGGQGALNQHLFKVTSYSYPKWFYYFWTKYHLPEFQEIAAGKATTMGHIQRHHLERAQVCIPIRRLLQRGDMIIGPMLERVIQNNIETRKLAAIRDSLLPKLMSGEIRVIS